MNDQLSELLIDAIQEEFAMSDSEFFVEDPHRHPRESRFEAVRIGNQLTIREYSSGRRAKIIFKDIPPVEPEE